MFFNIFMNKTQVLIIGSLVFEQKDLLEVDANHYHQLVVMLLL